MAMGKALQLEDPGVMELLRDYAALRTWEAIRGVRSVVTLSQLAESLGLDHRLLQRQVDLLALHGLIEVVKARRPRTTVGYRVTTDRIVVAFDDADPASVELAMASSASVGGEFDRCVEQHADPEFHPKAGFRFRQNTLQHFTQEDFAELRRRMLAVVEFLATPRPRPTQPKGSRAGVAPRPAHCNQAISILLEPLVGDLLPLPAVWVTPRSKLSQADPRHAERTGVGGLARREREVALALAEGLSRAHVAERMALSVHTVATIARRVYRKLGVSSQAGLAARLAGHARRELGEK